MSKACTTFTMYEQNLFHHLCQDGLHRSYTSVPSSKSLTCLWSNPYSLSAFDINDKEEKIFSSLITGPLLYDNILFTFFEDLFSSVSLLIHFSSSDLDICFWIPLLYPLSEHLDVVNSFTAFALTRWDLKGKQDKTWIWSMFKYLWKSQGYNLGRYLSQTGMPLWLPALSASRTFLATLRSGKWTLSRHIVDKNFSHVNCSHEKGEIMK